MWLFFFLNTLVKCMSLDKTPWNITKEQAIQIINKHIHCLFQLNCTHVLKLQYIQMNLNKTIRFNCGFQLLKNNKKRNFNNYIHCNFNTWNNFLKNSKYFQIKNKNLFITKTNVRPLNNRKIKK